MAEKKPICLYGGVLQELASGDTLPGGGLFTEPATRNVVGGTGSAASLTSSYPDNVIAGQNSASQIANMGYSTIVGNDALRYPNSGLGTGLIAIGFSAMSGHSTQGLTTPGEYSIGIGYTAGYNAKGKWNTIIGGEAARGGNGNIDLAESVVIGYHAQRNQTGQGATRNVVLGVYAMKHNYGASTDNVVIGHEAASGATSTGFQTGCNKNIVIGAKAGRLQYVATESIIIGYSAGPATANQSKQLFIDIHETDTPLIHGDFTAAAEKVTINGDFEVTGTVTGDFGSPSTVSLDNGSAATPALSFSSDTDTGLFYSSGIAFSYGGQERMRIGTSGLSFSAGEQILADKGSAASPGYCFGGMLTTGFYADVLVGGTVYLGFSGTPYFKFKPSTFEVTPPARFAAGTNVAPGISFTGDTNSGFHSPSGDQIRLTLGGNDKIIFASSYTAIYNTVWGADGSNTAPMYAFNTDTNTGIYKAAADELGITAGGVQRARFTSAGAIITGQAEVSIAAPTADAHLTRKDYVDEIARAHNVIINGNFDIWQRGTSFVAVTSTAYTADRFQYQASGAMVHTVSRDTNVPTVAQSGVRSNYSLLVDCTTADASIAAGDYAFIKYTLEGYDYSQLSGAGATATLSFWVKATKTGTYNLACLNAGSNRSYISEYTINTTDTWEKKTITVPLSEIGGTWNYTNGAGLKLIFTLAAGSTYQTTADAWQTGTYFGTSNQVNACDNVANNFRIAQVQFEKGDTATPFEFRHYKDELAKCQRYYQIVAGSFIGHYASSSGQAVGGTVHYPVDMRSTSPTITLITDAYLHGNANTGAETILGTKHDNAFSVYRVSAAAGMCQFSGKYKVADEL